MRLIDADKLKEYIDNIFVVSWEHDYDGGFKDACVEILNAIEDAPTIEIIRCGECKYWEESQYYPEFMVCTYVKGATFTRQHDDFCSRGERSEL